MAKKSAIDKNNKRQRLAQGKRASRNELKKVISKGNDEEREQALQKLHSRPRNESICRVRTRCRICGRPRGVLRKFGLCRICVRNLMMKLGEIPGLRKASW